MSDPEFYYLIPGAGNFERLAHFGLDDRFPPGRMMQADWRGEINGEAVSGIVYHWRGMLPKGVRWQVTADSWYIGFNPENPPTPPTLLRHGVNIRGVDVTLNDGNKWLIPLVIGCPDRDPNRTTGLPIQFAHTSTGKAGVCIQERYLSLVERAKRLLASFLDESLASPESEMLVNYVSDLLNVCYRVGRDEVLALGLISPDNAKLMINASIDVDERVAIAAAAEIAGG